MPKKHTYDNYIIFFLKIKFIHNIKIKVVEVFYLEDKDR